MLIQDGIIRMRWRNGWNATSQAPNMVAGTVYQVTIDVGIMSYIFNENHKIQVSISSSNYPRFSVNWNSGLGMINGTNGAVPAENVIGYGTLFPSKLILPQINLNEVRKHKLNLN